MGKVVAGAVAVAVTVGALVLAYAVGAPLGTVLGVAAGALALMWLLVLLTVPWNLYFRAHAVLAEIALSREKGLGVPTVRDTEASRIARIMLRTATGTAPPRSAAGRGGGRRCAAARRAARAAFAKSAYEDPRGGNTGRGPGVGTHDEMCEARPAP